LALELCARRDFLVGVVNFFERSIAMLVVKSMSLKRVLSFISVLLIAITGTVMGATAAHADQPGITWTGQTSASSNNWDGVTYGNGLFVAISFTGTGNRVMTSPDGINWTTRKSPSDNLWTAVTYGNGLFVAVAITGPSDQRVMTSPDGINWTGRTSPTNAWTSVTYGDGLFVAVAESGDNRVMTSPDGITWTTRTSAYNYLWNWVTYANGKFVAVSSGPGYAEVSPAGIKFIAATGLAPGFAMTSLDGITWTLQSSAPNDGWHTVVYGNGLFVSVSYTGTGHVMTSPDGITWTMRPSGTTNLWHSVTYGAGLFVATAEDGKGNRVMTSPDGITWTSRTTPADYAWHTVTYGSGLFVAVSFSGLAQTAPGQVTAAAEGSAVANRVMTSGIFNRTAVLNASAVLDTSARTAIRQSIPVSSTGLCTGIDDATSAYGSGITGGWVRSWEPWVNTTIGANGQRIGGWACTRTLVNQGGQWWVIAG
jgi:hypothetical protein